MLVISSLVKSALLNVKIEPLISQQDLSDFLESSHIVLILAQLLHVVVQSELFNVVVLVQVVDHGCS